MHAKHPTRMPGRGYVPGPTARKVRHVWSWHVKRDMTGEKRHRLFQVLSAVPVGTEWATMGGVRLDTLAKVPTFALTVQRVKRFGAGFVTLPSWQAGQGGGRRKAPLRKMDRLPRFGE